MEQKQKNILPDVDIVEHQDEVILFADLPGVEEKDLDITFEKGILKLTAPKKSAQFAGLEHTFGRASQAAAYERSFTVSKHIDPDGFAARLADGVLTLTMKKVKELQPKRIPVKTA